jgi:hypothetical protein
METVADVLQAMLDLYATPGAWTAKGIACNAVGRRVAPTSPEAVSWSLEGALERILGDTAEAGISEAEWERRCKLGRGVSAACGVNLMLFNDAAHRQEVVVAVLRMGLEHASLGLAPPAQRP